MISEMLLGYFTGILNKYIGEYFENIDSSQLTGSIFGGGVTLRNLNFRPTIFESLGLPFHVVAGKCGTLEVVYSLTRLYSEPVIVTIKDLFLLVTPTRCVKYDHKAETSAKHREKLRQLEIFEGIKHHIKQRLAERENAFKLPDMQKIPETTYFDTWIMQVLRNIQFQIESIHIRFEDDLTSKTEPFAIGMTLQFLKVIATDANWNHQFVKDYVPETIFKLAQASGFSIYWNPAPTALFKGIADKQDIFRRLNVIPKGRETGFKFLLGPMPLEFKTQITPFPDSMKEPFSKPRFELQTSFDELSLSLSDKQYKDFVMFIDTMEYLITSYKHRQFRPPVFEPPFYKGRYKEWWRFAYNCILEEIRRRRNNFRWEQIHRHRLTCRNYVEAYYKKTVEKNLDPSIEATVTSLEKDLSLFNLILLRKQVELLQARRTQERLVNMSTSTYIYSWVSYLLYLPASEPPPVPSPENSIKLSSSELTPHEKEELSLSVKFAKHLDVLSFPDDYIDVVASALFNELRFRIHRTLNRRKETVLDTILDKVSLTFCSRPVGDGLYLEVKLGKVEAYAGDFPRGALDDAFRIPQILTTANPGVTEYFLKFMYEKSPLKSEMDHKVSVEGLALQFTYHADAIQKLVDCFAVPKKEIAKERRGTIPASIILNRILNFKAMSTSKLIKLMDNKGKVELSICLISPVIVIPQERLDRGKANFVVMRLGEVNVLGTVIGGTLCENGACTDLL